MATKFTHQFKPESAGIYRVNLCDSDFSGSSSDIEMTAEPFVLNWENDDPHAYVISSGGQFNFIVQTQAQEDFFTAVAQDQTGRYTITIEEGVTDDFFWAGTLQASGIVIPYEARPFVVQVQADDDLARLADSYYTQTGKQDGTLFAPTTELIHVHLRRCLVNLRTQHHWANTDNFVQLFSYYETAAGDGFTGLKIFSQSFSTTDGEMQEPLTCLDVITEICRIFNSRLVLSGGIFQFHSLSHLEDAASFTIPVLNYRKDGVLFSPINFDFEKPFTGISKIAGWQTTFVPALHSVRMDLSASFGINSGYLQSLPSINQITAGTNSLSAGVFDLVTGGTAFQLVTMGAGFFAQLQSEQTLFEFSLVNSFFSFTLSETDPVDEVVRAKITISYKQLCFGGTFDGTTRFVDINHTFDSTNTQPILAEDGSTIECASVTYATPTNTAIDTGRIVLFSDPVHCGGSGARDFSRRFSIPLPALSSVVSTENACVPGVVAQVEFVKHDGTDLSSANQTTVDANVSQCYLNGLRVYNSTTATASGEPEVLAKQTNQLYRETLDLGTSIFGGINFITDGTDTIQTDFTSNGNTDGTDYIASLVVQDVLRLRSKPRRMFTGFGQHINTITFGFNGIYTDGSTRYALLGTSFEAGTGYSRVTFFELDRDAAVTIDDDSTDESAFGRGAVGKKPRGEITNISTSTLSAEASEAFGFQQITEKVDLALRKLMTSDERKTLRSRLAQDGTNVAKPLLPTETNKPGLQIFTASDGSAFSTDSIEINANALQTGSAKFNLPNVTTSSANQILTMRTQGGSQTGSINTIDFGSTAGHTLQMVDVSGSLVPQFAAASGGGAGGSGETSYTIVGLGTWSRYPVAAYMAMSASTTSASASSAQNVWPVVKAGQVTDFAMYSKNAAGSTTIALYKNGSSVETETATLTAANVQTGAFSTSFAAGDRLQIRVDPTTNPTAMRIVVKFIES